MKKYLIIILLFLFNINVFSSDYIYRSKVCDLLGHPVIGCSITNLNSGVATISDSEGKFAIPVKKNDNLRFSCLGYKSKEINCQKKLKRIILKDIYSCKKDSLYNLLDIATRLHQELYGNEPTIWYLYGDHCQYFDVEIDYFEYLDLIKLRKLLNENSYIYKKK